MKKKCIKCGKKFTTLHKAKVCYDCFLDLMNEELKREAFLEAREVILEHKELLHLRRQNRKDEFVKELFSSMLKKVSELALISKP